MKRRFNAMKQFVQWGMTFALFMTRVSSLLAEERYFDSKGVKIRYRDQGQGSTVLLIHGFGMNLDTQFALPGVIKGLAKDHRVIAFDVRGHGLSSKPHDPAQYGIEMVEDGIRLLDHLGIDKAHVVGYSMGAILAAKLQATHPDRLLSVTLGGTGPAFRDDPQSEFADELADSIDGGKGIRPLIELVTPQRKPTEMEFVLINTLFSAVNDMKALSAVVRSWKDLGVTEAEMRATTLPMLAIAGGRDPLRLRIEDLRKVVRDLDVIVIPNAMHRGVAFRPEFVQAVARFVAKHER